MKQNLFFQGAQLGPRLHAELAAQPFPQPPIGAEGIGLATGSIQGAHKETTQQLVERRVGHGTLNHRDHLGRMPGSDGGLSPLCDRALMLPFDNRRFLLHPWAIHIGQKRSTPEFKSRSEHLATFTGIIQGGSLLDRRPEAVNIGLNRSEIETVCPLLSLRSTAGPSNRRRFETYVRTERIAASGASSPQTASTRAPMLTGVPAWRIK